MKSGQLGQLGRLGKPATVAAWLLPAVLALAPPAMAQEEGGGAEPGGQAAEAGKAKEAKPPLMDPETGKPDVDRLLDYLDDLYRSDSSIARMTLTVTKPRRTRTLTMKAWSRGEDRVLIVIEKPARDKGTATLKVDKNLWNYLPKISRTIRIPPSMMLSSWMGSDFTNDDLVREASFREDFDGEVLGRVGPPAESQSEGDLPVFPPEEGSETNDSEEGVAVPPYPEGWLVNLKAKEGVVGLWNRIEYVISIDGKLPRQAKYYDRKDRLSRIMVFTDVRDFGGRKIPARLELTPLDKKKKGHKTVMVYEELEFDVDVPESTFSLSRLERKR